MRALSKVCRIRLSEALRLEYVITVMILIEIPAEVSGQIDRNLPCSIYPANVDDVMIQDGMNLVIPSANQRIE